MPIPDPKQYTIEHVETGEQFTGTRRMIKDYTGIADGGIAGIINGKCTTAKKWKLNAIDGLSYSREEKERILPPIKVPDKELNNTLLGYPQPIERYTEIPLDKTAIARVNSWIKNDVWYEKAVEKLPPALIEDVYCFVLDNLVERCKPSELCSKYSLDRESMSKLLRGKKKEVDGWKVLSFRK